jgi:hypothetical protein
MVKHNYTTGLSLQNFEIFVAESELFLTFVCERAVGNTSESLTSQESSYVEITTCRETKLVQLDFITF